MLNPQSPVPLYHQLADLLTRSIRSDEFEPGDMIPSENILAREHGIGRPTVRQAMDILVRKGLVERRRGSGTFVRQPEETIDLFSLAGTSQAFLTKGIQTSVKNICPVTLKKIDNDPANPFDAGHAFFLSRITQVENEPVLLEDIFLHPELFSGLDELDIENRSLAQVVSEHYFLKPDSGTQTFKICFPSKANAKLLELSDRKPVLEVHRTLDFATVKKALFSKLFCRTDRFAFSQTIRINPDD